MQGKRMVEIASEITTGARKVGPNLSKGQNEEHAESRLLSEEGQTRPSLDHNILYRSTVESCGRGNFLTKICKLEPFSKVLSKGRRIQSSGDRTLVVSQRGEVPGEKPYFR